MATERKIVIIGAGHNGLVAAFYLARAGWKPLVLERRDVVGGVAVTEEFHPGFRCSALLHAGPSLVPAIARDMRLERHGLRMTDGGRASAPSIPMAVSCADIRSAGADRRGNSQNLAARRGKIPKLLRGPRSPWGRPSSALDHDSAGNRQAHRRGSLGLLKFARGVRRLGKKNMQRLLRWGPMAVADFAAEWFETELLRATIAARGIFASAAGPWSPGTTAPLLLRVAAEGNPIGLAAMPKGGMGAWTAAMAAAARAAGAEIRTGAGVAQILVKDGAARGVALANGEEIAASAVVSGPDPRQTFLGLLDPVHLEPSFLVKMRNYRSSGTVAKVHLALDALPEFTALRRDLSGTLAGRIHIGPDIDYLERAFDASKYGAFSPAPYLDVTIPSASDTSLAPDGKHVMSVLMQFAPRRLRQGDWASQREALGDAVVKTLAQYAPNLSGQILARQVLTPQDLEETVRSHRRSLVPRRPGARSAFHHAPDSRLGALSYAAPRPVPLRCGDASRHLSHRRIGLQRRTRNS